MALRPDSPDFSHWEKNYRPCVAPILSAPLDLTVTQHENALFVLPDIFVFPLQHCLWLVPQAIFLPPVPIIVLFVAAARIRMCQAEHAPCAPQDTSVRLPVKCNLAILEDGAQQAKRRVMFVMLATTVRFQSIPTRSHVPVANIRLLDHQHAHCAPPAVFALSLEINDFLALQEAFLLTVPLTALFVQLESTLHRRPRPASLALRDTPVFPRLQAQYSALWVNTV